ncbi:MAG TPA: biopolymer transporter ExbD [Bacteroidales bacterium]
MNLRTKNKFRAEVSSSSLSDIMFFLMLFFLIMSTMVSPSVIKLTLPKAQHNQTVRKTEIAISITKDLKYYINNKEVDFANLENELVTELQKLKEPTVVIRVDNSIPVQDLVNVLQVGNKLKVKMILATKSPNG